MDINKLKFLNNYRNLDQRLLAKTVITGDVASFPGYRIPYKVFKILSN